MNTPNVTTQDQHMMTTLDDNTPMKKKNILVLQDEGQTLLCSYVYIQMLQESKNAMPFTCSLAGQFNEIKL